MTRYEKYIRIKHSDWQKKVNKHIPELAARVFVLRSRHYMGCGFHYSLEKCLGYVIRELNDYRTPFDFGSALAFEVVVAGLFKDVVEAERSADEMARKYGENSERYMHNHKT